MKKLFKVEIMVYVMAEDEYDAAMIATRECQPEEADVEEADNVDSRWWKAIPYGSTTDATCGEIIGEQKASRLQAEN